MQCEPTRDSDRLVESLCVCTHVKSLVQVLASRKCSKMFKGRVAFHGLTPQHVGPIHGFQAVRCIRKDHLLGSGHVIAGSTDPRFQERKIPDSYDQNPRVASIFCQEMCQKMCLEA